MKTVKRLSLAILAALGLFLGSAGQIHAFDYACSQFLLIDWGDYCTYYAQKYNGGCHDDPPDDCICWDRSCLPADPYYSPCNTTDCQQIPGSFVCSCGRKGQYTTTAASAEIRAKHGGLLDSDKGAIRDHGFELDATFVSTTPGQPDPKKAKISPNLKVVSTHYVQLYKANKVDPFLDQNNKPVYVKLFLCNVLATKNNSKDLDPITAIGTGVRVREDSAQTYEKAVAGSVYFATNAYLVKYAQMEWHVRMAH